MHDLGINSVYSTVAGPRIYGLKSLYVRQTSYFSKFNVGRVCSRILRYAFSVAYGCDPYGQHDQKKALVQNLLNADLNRLKAQGALRPNSSVRCDNTNNSDLDTNGGEILIVNYDCWFVKLIERVSISILATDSSVSAVIKQKLIHHEYKRKKLSNRCLGNPLNTHNFQCIIPALQDVANHGGVNDVPFRKGYRSTLCSSREKE